LYVNIFLAQDVVLVRGGGYYLCGEYEKAIETGEKGLKLAKEFGVPFFVSGIYWWLAMTLMATGDLKRAREYAKGALRISEECNAKNVKGLARIRLGCMVEEMTPAIIEEAEQQIRHGILLLEEMEVTSESYWLTRTKNALKKLESAAGAG